MSEAITAVLEIAREGLGLDRIEAATLPRNVPLHRVRVKNGFESYGAAREYLRIAGCRQDPHVPVASRDRAGRRGQAQDLAVSFARTSTSHPKNMMSLQSPGIG